MGFDFHRECLRCEECDKVLNPGQHAEVRSVRVNIRGKLRIFKNNLQYVISAQGNTVLQCSVLLRIVRTQIIRAWIHGGIASKFRQKVTLTRTFELS